MWTEDNQLQGRLLDFVERLATKLDLDIIAVCSGHCEQGKKSQSYFHFRNFKKSLEDFWESFEDSQTI